MFLRASIPLPLRLKEKKTIGLLISGIVLGPPGINGFLGYKPIGVLEKVWSREDYGKFRIPPRNISMENYLG